MCMPRAARDPVANTTSSGSLPHMQDHWFSEIPVRGAQSVKCVNTRVIPALTPHFKHPWRRRASSPIAETRPVLPEFTARSRHRAGEARAVGVERGQLLAPEDLRVVGERAHRLELQQLGRQPQPVRLGLLRRAVQLRVRAGLLLRAR